jgi:hypothetical protein
MAAAAALAAWIPATEAAADIKVDGNLRALQLSASGDSLADVLSRFGTAFAVKCRSAVPLQTVVRGSYSGSLSQVVARLLDGYNYMIRTERDETEIIVLGRAGEAAVVPKGRLAASTQNPIKTTTARWR